jgi:hypothetical protein
LNVNLATPDAWSSHCVCSADGFSLILCALCISVFLAFAPTTRSVYSATETDYDSQNILDQFFVFTFSFHLLKDFHCATYTHEKSFNGSETKAGKPVSVLDHNPFNFAPTSSVYDFEELATVVIQARGNFGTIKDDTIATLSTGFNQSLTLAREIFGLFLR